MSKLELRDTYHNWGIFGHFYVCVRLMGIGERLFPPLFSICLDEIE